MKKRIVAFMLAAMMCTAAFTACSSGKETQENTENTPSVEETVEKEEVMVELNDIVTAVKEAYGENYLPSMPYEEAMLSDVFGITMDDVEEWFAEGPMMSAHIDTFIVLKAKEGKVDSLKAELEAYLEQQKNDAMCYPNNLIRIQSGQVLSVGDYAIYMMLGGYDDAATTDEEIAAHAEEMAKVGVDAINTLFA